MLCFYQRIQTKLRLWPILNLSKLCFLIDSCSIVFCLLILISVSSKLSDTIFWLNKFRWVERNGGKKSITHIVSHVVSDFIQMHHRENAYGAAVASKVPFGWHSVEGQAWMWGSKDTQREIAGTSDGLEGVFCCWLHAGKLTAPICTALNLKYPLNLRNTLRFLPPSC